MNTERVQNTLRKMSPVALIIAAIVSIAAIAYAGASVYHLFSVFVGLPPVESAFATLASVGMAVALLFVVITTPNQNARGLGAILMIAWVLLTLCLVALDSVMRADLLMAPEALLQLGQILAAVLPALALAGVLGMAVALHDTSEVKSAAGASSKYIGFCAKGVAIGASVFASTYFGINKGINPVLAVLCGALLESAFLWSYLAMKLSRDRGDRFDVRMWGFCTLMFGVFIAAVSVETLSTLAGIDVPIVSALGEIGASLYVSAVGLSLVLTVLVHLLTRAIDDVPQAQPAEASPYTIAENRLARGIRGVRQNASQVKAALRNAPPQVPQLTSGQPAAQMAKDGVDAPRFDETELPGWERTAITGGGGPPRVRWTRKAHGPDMMITKLAHGDAESASLAAADAEAAAERASDAKLVGVAKPRDTKVGALNGHTNTALDEAAAKVRAEAVARKAKRAGGEGPKS